MWPETINFCFWPNACGQLWYLSRRISVWNAQNCWHGHTDESGCIWLRHGKSQTEQESVQDAIFLSTLLTRAWACVCVAVDSTGVLMAVFRTDQWPLSHRQMTIARECTPSYQITYTVRLRNDLTSEDHRSWQAQPVTIVSSYFHVHILHYRPTW